jgi:hypothetical protein
VEGDVGRPPRLAGVEGRNLGRGSGLGGSSPLLQGYMECVGGGEGIRDMKRKTMVMQARYGDIGGAVARLSVQD